MLEYELWGNTLSTWGTSILIILVAILVVKLFSWFSRKVLQPFVTRTKNHVDDTVYYSFESPIKFAILLLGFWIAIHRLVYPDSFVKWVDDAYKILIVLNITWIFARLFSGLLQLYWGKKADSETSKMFPVINRTILVVVWVLGLVMALSNVGVNISALLGTLGIGGIAFALAAQDTVKNVFGAFTIFTDRPFSLGDTIHFNDIEGTVIDVGARSTRIMNYDRRVIAIPNYKITDAAIINISSEPMRRVVMKISLTYDTTAERMKQALDILRAIPKRVEYVSSTPSDVVANFSDFSDSSLDITYMYYIKKPGDVLKVASDMNMEVLESFNKAGLEFAFPTQTIYVQKEDSQEESEDDNKDRRTMVKPLK